MQISFVGKGGNLATELNGKRDKTWIGIEYAEKGIQFSRVLIFAKNFFYLGYLTISIVVFFDYST
jgi:hypothetical protein